MYTDTNFASKKALREALAAGKQITCHSPGPWPCPDSGWISLEGPHYPKAHSWYAQARLEGGLVVEVKK